MQIPFGAKTNIEMQQMKPLLQLTEIHTRKFLQKVCSIWYLNESFSQSISKNYIFKFMMEYALIIHFYNRTIVMLKTFVFSSLQNSVLQQVLCLHVSNYMTQSKAFQWLNVCNGVGYNLYVTLWRIKNQSHSIHYLSFILVVVVVDEAILPNIQTFAKFHTSILL